MNKNELTRARRNEITTLSSQELYTLLDSVQNTTKIQERDFVIHCINIISELDFVKVADHNRKYHNKPIMQFFNSKQEQFKRGYVATTHNNDYYYGYTKKKAIQTALESKTITYPVAD